MKRWKFANFPTAMSSRAFPAFLSYENETQRVARRLCAAEFHPVPTGSRGKPIRETDGERELFIILFATHIERTTFFCAKEATRALERTCQLIAEIE